MAWPDLAERRRRWRPALGLLLALAAATPARAQQQPLDSVRLDSADTIGWRQLVRADFRGERPPDVFVRGPQLPVAVSCTFLVPDAAARIYALPTPTADGRRYRARIEGLTFRALLSRRCSSWNAGAEVSPAYVLQHEQIHFDIFEVAARRLNKDLPGMLSVLAIDSDSAHTVVRRAQGFVQGLVRRALEETAQRNLEFDRQTSFGFELAQQAAWRFRLDADLADLRVHAAPAPAATAP